jgi:hypothetical protein
MCEIETNLCLFRYCETRDSESITHFPPALCKLLNGEVGYHNETVVFEDDMINGSIGISASETQIDNMVTKYSSKFVMAIVQSTSNWALITHLDAFYQQDSSVDDCALPRNTDMNPTAKAMVLQKTEGPYNFKELIIQCGPIQLLIIGGYYGQLGNKNKNAFLGSDLPKNCSLSTEESYQIMTPFFQAR